MPSSRPGALLRSTFCGQGSGQHRCADPCRGSLDTLRPPLLCCGSSGAMYIRIDDYNEFTALAGIPRSGIRDALIERVRTLREAQHLEESVLRVLGDPNRTSHGPAEVADILTVQLSHRTDRGLAAFVLKGRSFPKVTPADISHQVFRLRKLADLRFAILGHTGHLADQARDEFIQTATDTGVHYTIIDATDFARICVFAGLLCPRDGQFVRGGRCVCGYRFGGDQLNALQTEALGQLATAHQLGQRSGVLVLPTASGKTRIGAIDSRRQEAQRVLFVAHTNEILDGAEREFAHVYGAQSVHRTWRTASSAAAPSVHLDTIQGISRHIPAIAEAGFDYLIIDEFHHAAALSYRRLIDSVRPSFLLGLTATPFRGDRQDVVELCDGNVIAAFELRTGIDMGILAPYWYYGCFDDVDYSILRRAGGRYSTKDLNKALIIPERDEAIVAKWTNLARDRPTLAFCCSQVHARRMAEAFRAAGIEASPYLGTTPLNRRLELITSLQYAETKVLCCVDVLNEGFDIPFVECLLFLRPTESKRLFLQQLGRGLRKHPGKTHVVVLDFIGNFYNAVRIVEYLGLRPEEVSAHPSGTPRSAKQVLDLPLGCRVEFEDRVVDIFAQQVRDPGRATRQNIAQVLIHVYRRTSAHLGRPATRREVDRYQILHAGLYDLVFGSWASFERIMRQ